MKSLAYVSYSAGTPGSSFFADGLLSLRQLEPLKDDSTRKEYLSDLLEDGAPAGYLQASSKLRVNTILESYFDRNETTIFDTSYTSWQAGDATHGFTSDILIRIPAFQQVFYKPSTIEILKFGWIQFLASFVVFFWLLSWWEWYIFHYRILDTRMTTDLKSKLKSF